MHPLFFALNSSRSQRKIVAHPYIRSRTTNTLTFGVFFEQPLPSNVGLYVSCPMVGVYRAPLSASTGDQYAESTVAAPNMNGTTAALLYLLGNLVVDIPVRFRNIVEAGPQILCPTLRFNLKLSASMSMDQSMITGEWFNPFAQSEIGLSCNGSYPLATSSDLEGLCIMTSDKTSIEETLVIEMPRSSLQIPDDDYRVGIYYNLHSEANIIAGKNEYLGNMGVRVKADGTQEIIANVGHSVDSRSPYIDNAYLGTPTFANYLRLGISQFDINFSVVDVGFIQ